MELYKFSFTGYQNYYQVENEIGELLARAFKHNNPRFIIAMNEAICNAAMYSICGIMSAAIEINIRLTDYDIAVNVQSTTNIFDTKKYQANLQTIAKDPVIAAMDWGDYMADKDNGRGIWYMLTAVDYLYFDTLGQSITLVTHTDSKIINTSTKIGELVPRFLVNEGGVIN